MYLYRYNLIQTDLQKYARNLSFAVHHTQLSTMFYYLSDGVEVTLCIQSTVGYLAAALVNGTNI